MEREMGLISSVLNSAYTVITGKSADGVRKEKEEDGLSLESSKGAGVGAAEGEKKLGGDGISGFQMPVHYPRYRKEDYEKMEEWKIDMLLGEYGIGFNGTIEEKRNFAIGAFLWPHQLS